MLIQILFIAQVTFAQYWPAIPDNTPLPQESDIFSANPTQTNLGPLPPFKLPASCTLYTGDVFIVRATEMEGDNTTPIFTTTYYSLETLTAIYLGGIGGENSDYAPYPTATDPSIVSTEREASDKLSPVPCMPTNYFNGLDPTIYHAQRYYSPAPSCPDGRKIANSTTFTSTSTFSGKAALVTETAALCCPDGYYIGYRGGLCESSGTGTNGAQDWSVTAYYSYDNPTSLVAKPTTLFAASVIEYGVQIRWQATDVTPGATLPTYIPKTTNAATATGTAAASATSSKKSNAGKLAVSFSCVTLGLLAMVLVR